MVSTLYRTHKSLPKDYKISSLYVFDALARAAKQQVKEHGLSLDASNQFGNAATFLSKLGGVVEGLFQDMLSSNIPESQVSLRYFFPTEMAANAASSSIGVSLLPMAHNPFRLPVRRSVTFFPFFFVTNFINDAASISTG